MRNQTDAEFLLNTKTAQILYHTYAESLPIIDYHCHVNPRDIWEDKTYQNITQLWLGVGGSLEGDHYKWRLMRSYGIDERYITGNAPDEERFLQWADCLSRAIGNPLYHWSHMELQKYFGISEWLTADNAAEIYAACNETLQIRHLSVREIIRQSRVQLICTTDDPADSLEWHQKLAADPVPDLQVLPAMRPDKAMAIESADYLAYLKRLEQSAAQTIQSFSDLQGALRKRMDAFGALGCRIADHGLTMIPFAPASNSEIERIFASRLSGQMPTEVERQKFATAFLQFAAQEYSQRGWVMQLHFGCQRNVNTARFQQLGPDTGYDCIGDQVSFAALAALLDSMEQKGCLPKTILYSLNPNDNAVLDSVIGSFQRGPVTAKIQHGAAWWFNDHFQGITDQMTSLANLGLLAGSVGMLTDSRSFLSYVRHDYFRRILCRLLGTWVENGFYPCNWNLLGEIVKNICFNNAVTYFGFQLDPV